MDPRHLFADERYASFCAFCGGRPATREHVASRVLLDEPLPHDLPLIRSCRACNSGFSRGEQYLACLIDCVISGSADPEKTKRPKVRASLTHSPALAARIAASRTKMASGTVLWKPEYTRVRNVAVKLARGHVAHQYGEPQLDEPTQIAIMPLAAMSAAQREAFEIAPNTPGWPEIGCRAFVKLSGDDGPISDLESGWHVLQPSRYRYLVAQPSEIVVRVVLSEYLAAEVVW